MPWWGQDRVIQMPGRDGWRQQDVRAAIAVGAARLVSAVRAERGSVGGLSRIRAHPAQELVADAAHPEISEELESATRTARVHAVVSAVMAQVLHPACNQLLAPYAVVAPRRLASHAHKWRHLWGVP